MKVLQNDTTFSAHLITGPTHNFLSVRFSNGPAESIIYIEMSGKDAVRTNQPLIEGALASHGAQIPLRNTYFPHEIFYRDDDTPSMQHYDRLIWKIFEAAQARL